MWAMPGRVMSSMNLPWPVIRRGSSRRWILAPIMVVIAIGSAPSGDGLRSWLRRCSAHRGGCSLHRLDDVHVAGAATKVALETLSDLVVRRVRVLCEQIRGGHDETGRKVVALEAVLVPERLL